MNLTLTTQSYVLFGSGEGHALIDADTTFHTSGFPYVPGRRIKGLLRESLMEVMEMFGENADAIAAAVGRLFGTAGSKGPEGGLVIPNLYLHGWKTLLKDLKTARDVNPVVFHIDNVKRHYCSEVPQTAVKDGVAKDKSLRLYRVLNPGHQFTAVLNGFENLNEKDQNWFKMAVRNLKSAGTRRNKGFGEILLELEEETPPMSLTNANSALNWQSYERLQIRVKTLSPVLLSMTEGDQNTVSTERQIPGSVLRGLFAELWIKQLTDKPNAHKDEAFRESLLLGKMQFGTCFLDGALPLPFNLQTPKGKKSEPIKDAFQNQEESFRSVRGMGKFDGQELVRQTPKTTFMFHNSRPDRMAGKSMEQDAEQGIFYYEALAEGQTFVGELHGGSETMKAFIGKFGTSIRCQMGRSRSAQYGDVEITLQPLSDPKASIAPSNSQRYYVQVLSPLILLNRMGLAQADQTVLNAKLVSKGLGTVKLIQAFTQYKFVELFNGVWASKTTRMSAFASGSVFELEIEDHDLRSLAKLASSGIGEWTALGYGQVRIWRKEDFPKSLHWGTEAKKAVPSDSDHAYLDAASDWGSRSLNEIWAEEVERSIEVVVRLQALNAVKKKGINNHLASRILAKLISLQSQGKDAAGKWTSWLAEIKSKPAGKALDEQGLLEALQPIEAVLPADLKGLQGLPKSTVDYGFLYWITFFEAMRKRKERNHESV
jgi:CRISPR-associated protein Csx10